MEENKPDINLQKYRQHQRRIPWGLIRKIIIGASTIGLIYYFINQMEGMQKEQEVKPAADEVEVDVEL